MSFLVKPRSLVPLLAIGAIYHRWSSIKGAVSKQLPFVPGEVSHSFLVLACVALLLQAFSEQLKTPMRFAWNCFFKPLKNNTGLQAERLDSFYGGQADLYDATRGGLLKGRTTMLELVASHLGAQGKTQNKQRRVWVDIGGGTGWNIEEMSRISPGFIESFDAVYLIDLCEPLLEVARKRFAAKGWKNVFCIKQDATAFVLPEWEQGVDPRGSVTLATLSYSLSMIPAFYSLLDRINSVLDPEVGLVGVVDFYTAKDGGVARERAIGSASRKVNWVSRWFWQMWFEADHVYLGPARRDYLEHKLGTLKSFNGRNNFLIPYIVQIPFYIFLGCSRARDISAFTHALDVEAGNRVGLSPGLKTPASPFTQLEKGEEVPHFDLGPAAVEARKGAAQDVNENGQVVVDIGPPASAFHYQLRKPVRVPYLEEKIHAQFRTFVYAFVWEDPAEDGKHMKLTDEDEVLCITSAGDNALAYAIQGGPKRIHCVDMNPCQGHILELKLACVQALTYEEFYAMFGDGKQPLFLQVLDSKLAPYLSSHAYQYWRNNADFFAVNFYYEGYSGHALRLARWAFWLCGITGDVEKMANASNVWEQDKIWREKVRPVIFKPWLVRILGSRIFLWNALGVPVNQLNTFLQDGSVEDFIAATLDPVPKLAAMRTGAYHYLLCLTGKYSPLSCPLYLTRAGFEKLRKDDCKAVDSFRLHTDTIINVLRGLSSNSLTHAVIMDSQDWFDPIPPSTPLPRPHDVALDLLDASPEAAIEHLRSELDFQILELRRVLKRGGRIWFRSAGKRPWYLQRYELAGFNVEAVSIRENGKAIDRVNMYSSFYKVTKTSD